MIFNYVFDSNHMSAMMSFLSANLNQFSSFLLYRVHSVHMSLCSYLICVMPKSIR
ncbi:unnamed protein product [Brassica rapa]|uniref:Uncharacterized protein n=1 Tax=Brassica campestris TaxID=3711 RepID=A0A8D9HWC3_BRACM|nr:unnamed protein product [Brassica rapa]